MATAKKRQEERADQADGYERDDDEDNDDDADDSFAAAADEYDDADDPDNSSGGGSDVTFNDDVASSYGNVGLSMNSHVQQPSRSPASLPLSMTSSTAAEMFRRRDSDSYGTFAPLVN